MQILNLLNMKQFLLIVAISAALVAFAGCNTQNKPTKEDVRNQIRENVESELKDRMEDREEEREDENEEPNDEASDNPNSTAFYEYFIEDNWDGGLSQDLMRTSKETGETELYISELNAQQGALTLVSHPDNSDELYFRGIIPDSDASMMEFYVLDITTQKVEEMAVNSLLADTTWGYFEVSPNQKHFVWVPNIQDQDSTELYVGTFASDSYTLEVSLASGETFNEGSFALSQSFDIEFVDNDTIKYAVYNASSKAFIEYRQVSS